MIVLKLTVSSYANIALTARFLAHSVKTVVGLINRETFTNRLKNKSKCLREDFVFRSDFRRHLQEFYYQIVQPAQATRPCDCLKSHCGPVGSAPFVISGPSEIKCTFLLFFQGNRPRIWMLFHVKFANLKPFRHKYKLLNLTSGNHQQHQIRPPISSLD